MRTLQEFLPPDLKPGVIHTDPSLEFIRACEDLLELELRHVKPKPIRNQRSCRTRSP